ncbi:MULTISPECIES: hypothetical protein [Roseobacteraceae]|uniref:hypothetical protein n=1 Tax=Roseobacteraceae TaxID=2854170 RepID=UPI002B26CF49|nr:MULTISPECIES: hypothetical protein [Roseobacteraceae]
MAADAAVALDFGPCAAPLLAAVVAAEGALVISVCPCFVLRDRLRLLSEIPDLGLGVLDLGRIQVVESIENTPKNVLPHGYPPRRKAE